MTDTTHQIVASYQPKTPDGTIDGRYVLCPDKSDFTTIIPRLPEPLNSIKEWERLDRFELNGTDRIATAPDDVIIADFDKQGFHMGRTRVTIRGV